MSKNIPNFARVAIACVLATLAACGGNEGGDAGGVSPPPRPGIGAAGGTVTGPGGAKVVIPAGALTADTAIEVTQGATGSPALPAGFTTLGSMFAFTPHGTAFALAVTITLPFDPALVPAGATPALYKTNGQNQWEPVAGAVFGADNVSAEITGFSFAQVLIPPLSRNEPTRVWEFGGYPGNGGAEIDFGGATQVGGLLEQTVDFGMGFGDIDIVGLTETVPAAGKARGYVFGTANGATYGAYAEAPFAELGGSAPVGGITRLTQTQSFIKRAADASLKFTLSKVMLSGGDYNLFAPSVGYPDTTITAEVYFDVRAFTLSNRTIFRTAGGAMVKGHRPQFNSEVWNYRVSQTPLWSDADFEFTRGPITDPNFGLCVGERTDLVLRAPRTYTIDLTSIEVGEEFTLRSEIFASAENRRGGGSAGDCQASAAVAYLRDPLEIGGTTLEISGLEPTNRPVLTLPAEVPVEPAACVPGADPAGEIQFSAAAFEAGENVGASPTIRVTRTAGTRGAVTATFTTRDGTARGDTDYAPVNATVFFADGDDAPRVIEVPISVDALDEPDETVNLTLSQPGGCAVLGPQTTAVLSIVDDDLPPPTGLPGALDATFGTAGKASLAAFGGDRSGMAVQPDGKIVMVGGTFTDFVLARFNADGSIDSSFGTAGRVTTDVVAGQQEEALAVALQSDGKIVVAGYSGTGGVHVALARYNANGSLDAGFGTGGRVLSVVGIAYAVAIQPNGAIVVAGEAPRSNGEDFGDFVVARLLGNGAPDPAFASSGVVTTDIGAGTNTARNVVLQPDGAIVVSGEPFGTFAGSDHTDIVRYQSNGAVDATFGAAGKLTLGGTRVGEGLALTPDGKLALVGSAPLGSGPAGTSQFLVRRLNADGSADTTFGGAGAVTTSFSDRGDAAFAVTIQQDGKLVVAGRSSSQTNSNFAVARYLVNGVLDATFANAGKQTVDFFGFSDSGENIAIQGDAKIVVGGLARDQVDGYGVVRINP